MTNKAKAKETFGKAVFGIAAVICIIAVIAIFAFLIIKSVPAFNKLGIVDFVFGDNWAPDRNDTFDTENISGSYGIFSMIVGTFAASIKAGCTRIEKVNKTVTFLCLTFNIVSGCSLNSLSAPVGSYIGEHLCPVCKKLHK